jgi:hypothetical protein
VSFAGVRTADVGLTDPEAAGHEITTAAALAGWAGSDAAVLGAAGGADRCEQETPTSPAAIRPTTRTTAVPNPRPVRIAVNRMI